MSVKSGPLTTPPALEDRVLSQAVSETVLQRLHGFVTRKRELFELEPEITSWWAGAVRWGRNQVTLVSDRRDANVVVETRQGLNAMATNQLDDASLGNAVRTVEQVWEPPYLDKVGFDPPRPSLPMPKSVIWSDATYNMTPEAMAEVVRPLIASAEAAGLWSAGYLEMRAGSRLWFADQDRYYVRYTQAQCSITVRDPQGKGSGWAGLSNYDWAKIDAPALAAQALEKCRASQDAVALEPGRYTVILEPQAVADLLEEFVASFGRGSTNTVIDPREILAELPELDNSPFAYVWDEERGLGISKLGMRIVDDRLTLSHDPADPELGIFPAPGTVPVSWIEKGVLTNLAYPRDYAVHYLNENLPVRPPAFSYRLSGGTTAVPAMIATTKRGLLVTRFSRIRLLDTKSLLATGLTRDGLWLIENGKITKPVKNFRFTESPLFALNQLEQLGVPARVFRPAKPIEALPQHRRFARYGYYPTLTPALVPPLKVRDFSFTALADAV